MFRGMIRINGNQSWQAIFDTVVDNSRWDLDPTTVVRYQRHTFDLVADFLIHDQQARAGPGRRILTDSGDVAGQLCGWQPIQGADRRRRDEGR